MIQDNERIYDEQIAPLMGKIIEICKEHDIPLACSFEYAPGDHCSTAWHVEGQSNLSNLLQRTLRRSAAGGPLLPPLLMTAIVDEEPK